MGAHNKFHRGILKVPVKIFLANIPRGCGELVFCVLGIFLILLLFSRLGLVSVPCFDRLDEEDGGIPSLVGGNIDIFVRA